MSRPRPGKRRTGLILTLFILALAALMVWRLPVFRLQVIDISELRSLSEEDVLAASGLKIGQHLFQGLGGSPGQISQLRYAAAEAGLAEACPAIKSVTVKMVFPGKISLTIEERIEVAYVSIPDGCVMIDKEGVAIRVLSQAPERIPVIEGITVTSLIPGQPLGVDVNSALNSAISLMGAIIDADKDSRPELQLLPLISKIRPIGGNDLYLTVILPATGEELSIAAETGQNLAEDMLWLRFALSQGVFNGRGKGVLDLTGNRKTFTPD